MSGHGALRNTFYSSVAMYTEFVLGMITSIMIARYLGPEAYGSYSAAIWLVGLGIAFTNSGTASSAIRFIAELRGAGHSESGGPLLLRLSRLQRKYLFVVLLLFAAGLFLSGSRFVPMFDHRWLYGFLAIAIALRSAYMFQISIAKGHEDFRSIAWIMLVTAPVNLLLVLAVILLKLPAYWLLIAFLASSMLFYLLSRWRVRGYLHSNGAPIDAKMVPRIRRQVAYSTMIVSLGFLAASEMEVMLLNAFSHPDDAGQFKVAHQLATGAASLVPGVFGALLLPMMARALSEGSNAAGECYASSTTYLTLLAAPLAAFGWALGPSLVQLLYGSSYVESAQLLPLFLTCTCVLAATGAGSSLLISADRQNIVLLVLIGCFFLKLLLGSLLIAKFNLSGAAVSFAVTSMANAFATMYMAGKTTHGRLEWPRLRRVLVAGVIAALIVWPLHYWLRPLPAVLVGSIILAIAYAICTFLFGCWRQGDIDVMRRILNQFPVRGSTIGARILDWAQTRSAREESEA